MPVPTSNDGFFEAYHEGELELLKLVGAVTVAWSASVDHVRNAFLLLSELDVKRSTAIFDVLRNDRLERKVLRRLVEVTTNPQWKSRKLYIEGIKGLDACAEERNHVMHTGFSHILEKTGEGRFQSKFEPRRQAAAWQVTEDTREKLKDLHLRIRLASQNISQANARTRVRLNRDRQAAGNTS